MVLTAETKLEAIRILEGAISCIKNESEKPSSNNLDSIELVSDVLSRCGIK